VAEFLVLLQATTSETWSVGVHAVPKFTTTTANPMSIAAGVILYSHFKVVFGDVIGIGSWNFPPASIVTFLAFMRNFPRPAIVWIPNEREPFCRSEETI
jgi:hypothetical protein